MLLFAGRQIASGQEVYDLSRCIQLGLERNFALKVSRNNEQIATNNYSIGNAGMLPVITSDNRFGGNIITTDDNYQGSDDAMTRNIHNTAGSAAINLGMDLFRGMQVQHTYDKLGAQSDLWSLNTRMEIENLVSRIVAEYSYYIQQLILNDNLAYAVSLSRERVRIDEQRYLLGGASKLELLQSTVYLNADSSRHARQTEILKTSQVRLNELMVAEDLNAGFRLQDSAISINENLIYNELLPLTLENNTSLLIASKNQVITELDYKIIQSRTYPYLTMSAGYGYNFYGFETGELSNRQTWGLNYGLTLGMTLFDGFNQRREKSNARVAIENKAFQYQEIEQEIRADLLKIYYVYLNNIGLLRLEEQNLEVARENLDIALERYKLGNLAGLELREVQKSLLDAEERLISVKYQTKLAEISLQLISGKIMEYME